MILLNLISNDNFILTSLLIPSIVSILITVFTNFIFKYISDRGHLFLNKSTYKHKILEAAPKILFAKINEICENQCQSKIFTASILAKLIDNDNVLEEHLSYEFKQISSLSKTPNEFGYGIRLQNQSGEGISLDIISNKQGEIIGITNLAARHIDSGCSLILLFPLRDCPKVIEATFKGEHILYNVNSAKPSTYIQPVCQKNQHIS